MMAPLEADFLWLLAFGIALGRVQGARDRIDKKGCAADWLYQLLKKTYSLRLKVLPSIPDLYRAGAGYPSLTN